MGSFLNAGLGKEMRERLAISKLQTVTLRQGGVMELARAKQGVLLSRTVPECAPSSLQAAGRVRAGDQGWGLVS